MDTNKIKTTHVGSLPRPESLLALMKSKEDISAIDQDKLSAAFKEATAEVVAKQRAIGIDVVSDGEMSKPSYATYMTERLTGFGEETSKGHIAADLKDYRDLAVSLVKIGAVVPTASGVQCQGPVKVKSMAPIKRDIDAFYEATRGLDRQSRFMSCASPGIISVFQENIYYKSEDAYLEAIAMAMAKEYEAIYEAGFMVQIDSPDLAMNRHLGFQDRSDKEFILSAEKMVEVLNVATKNIPKAALRLHLCWGNYEGPHHHDMDLEKILPVVYKARPSYLLMEAANPRHAHEWEVFKSNPLPDDKILVPGVIDTCTNYLEHPKLICQRLLRFAKVIGRERLMAGTDCGFSTFAGYPTVDPQVSWAKLKMLVEGAAMATQKLWPSLRQEKPGYASGHLSEHASHLS